jgi:uncharacterized repeat protein (TIGR03803 family)
MDRFTTHAINRLPISKLLCWAYALAAAAAMQAQTETTLYSFACNGACVGNESNPGPNGAFPATGVTLDSSGNLYGTAPGGNTQNGFYFGVVYKVDTSGNETVLYAFCSADLCEGTVSSGVIFDTAGYLYLTTSTGPGGAGILYRLNQSGDVVHLYQFIGQADGADPTGGLIVDPAGNLYGTAAYGGAAAGTAGFGVVFKVDPRGNETVLYTFTGGADGCVPLGGVVMDSAGNLYGTTEYGGVAAGTAGFGVVFKLDTSGKETVLHSFTGGVDGGIPLAGVVLDSSGNLYGTTYQGGAANQGGVFQVDTAGNETVLHSFNSAVGDGGNPMAGVILDAEGNLYGTTLFGGTSGRGGVFAIDPAGNEVVLYGFSDGYDGAYPKAGVTLSPAGQLYGTTNLAGQFQGGVVFRIGGGFKIQTISFGALSNQPYGTAPFNVGATASSGLTVGFGSQTPAICTVSGTTVSLVAGGTCTIQATQAGNATYAAATPVNQSFRVTPASQTIAFGALPNQPYGAAPFMVSATASSGLAVSFNSQTTPVCKVSGTTVTLVTVGTCTIQATQAGNADYTAAAPVDQSFQVTPLGQTIDFGALSNQPYGAPPFTVGATASSGLKVTFKSLTNPVCRVSGTTVTLAAGGACTIQANQPGNADYAAAAPVDQTFQVTPLSQTIDFGALPNQAFGTPSFTVGATASSGLKVTFKSQTTPVCRVAGTTVTLAAAGACTIQATQAGNADYTAAAPVNQTFQVTQANQTITFAPLSNQALGTPPFTVGATASSGLRVSFNSQTTPVCKVAGTTVRLVAAGACTIQATQAGNADYTAATPVEQSFQVTP